MAPGFFIIALFVTISPLIAISLRFLSPFYDPVALMLARYTVGSILFLAIALLRFRCSYFSYFNPKVVFALLLVSILNCAAGLCWLKAVSVGTATMFQVIGVVGIPLTIILGAAFFADERSILSKRNFQLGAFIALVGTFLNVTSSSTVSFNSSEGVVWSLLAISLFSIIGLLLKVFVKALPTLVITSGVLSMSSVFLLIFSLAIGADLDYIQGGATNFVILILSGVMGTCIWTYLEMPILKSYGLAVLKMITLVFPVTGLILEYLLLGQVATSNQIFCGSLVIFGSFVSLIGIYDLPILPYLTDFQVRMRARTLQLVAIFSITER